jgi:hypothetical protein
VIYLPRPCPYSNDEIKKTVIELMKRGYSQRQMAKIIGCRQTRIRRIQYELGIQPRQLAKHRLWKPTVKIPEKEWKIGYLAGLIDGEGSLSVDKDYNMCSIFIANTSMLLVDWLQKNFGGHICKFKKRRDNWSESYRWYASRTLDVKIILEAVIPYLTIKQDAARKMLEIVSKRIEAHSPISPSVDMDTAGRCLGYNSTARA